VLGIVTEVYPATAKNLPVTGQVTAVAGGLAEWRVHIAARGMLAFTLFDYWFILLTVFASSESHA
jgi:hypothetical protein